MANEKLVFKEYKHKSYRTSKDYLYTVVLIKTEMENKKLSFLLCEDVPVEVTVYLQSFFLVKQYL